MSIENKALAVSLGYRWVMISKVLDLNSPKFWHSHFIEVNHKESGNISVGVKIVRELENHIIILEAAPIPTEPDYWVYKGWVLEAGTIINANSYPEMALQCEVLAASEEPTLSATYLIGNHGLPSNKVEAVFENTANGEEYAFGILLESHARATYLKHLLKGLESTTEGFKLEMVREDVKIITAFGEAYKGKWSLMLTEDPINNTYDAEFTFWKNGTRSSSNLMRENNPTIASEESQYFIGSLIKEPRIQHLAKCLEDSLSKYQ